MREIKFRTWDKKYQMLEYDVSPDLLIGMDGKVYQKEERNYAGTTFIEYEVVNHYEIMQYTGLKDKNGKEIYEGDVVDTVYDGKLFTGVIIYDESELDFKATNGEENYGSNFQYLPCCDEVKVIGNIYENPELLEASE